MSGQAPSRYNDEASPGARETPRLPPGFDPDVWAYNAEANEFQKIITEQKGYYLLETRTHEQRLTKYISELHRFERKRWFFGASIVAFILAMIWGMNCDRFIDRFSVYLLVCFPTGGCAFVSVCDFFWMKAVKLPALEKDIGPPPPARPGREQVERQKVHGAGGLLSGDRLKEAARGSATSSGAAAPLETFDD